MKKSELKKRILEALTPDEASKVDAKYKEIYAGMVGKNPLKMKKYDNPDKVAYGRAINLIQKESLKLAEKLGKDADLGDHIDDFTDSDAPQFKGKSKKKIRQMATAAFLNKEEQNLGEEIENSTFQKHADRVEDLLKQLLNATKSVDSSQDDTENDVEELDKSIDYLAAAITDKDPLDIELDQSIFGRLAKPTNEEIKLNKIDAIMEESAYDAGRLEKKVKSILKKEGGAVGLKPLVDAAKELGASKKDLMDILKKMKDVKTHKDGDIIDASGLNEGHSLDQKDLDTLESLRNQIEQGTLNSKKQDAYVKVLDYLIKSNIKQGDLGTKVDEASGMEKAKKNMDMYKDKNRLTEFVKAALMKETSTDKYDDNPALKGKQSDLPDGLQKAIIKKKSGDVDESFDSLAKKLDKQKGITKDEAGKIAGKIANIKRKGGGKGPTAKQKKRMAETILKELRGNINEAEVSPQAAADKAIKTLATKLEKSPKMDKLAAQVAKSPKLMAQLEKAVKAAGVNIELAEDESGLDMGDMKKMALNLAKKSKSVNEKQEYLDDDGSLDVGLGMASFVGGGSLGAAFGSAIVAAVPAITGIFAGPALLGAAAGVGLFLLARKVYLSDRNYMMKK